MVAMYHQRAVAIPVSAVPTQSVFQQGHPQRLDAGLEAAAEGHIIRLVAMAEMAIPGASSWNVG